MKYLTYFFVLSVMLVSCQNKDKKTDKATEPDVAAEYVLYEVEIEGMACTDPTPSTLLTPDSIVSSQPVQVIPSISTS